MNNIIEGVLLGVGISLSVGTILSKYGFTPSERMAIVIGIILVIFYLRIAIK